MPAKRVVPPIDEVARAAKQAERAAKRLAAENAPYQPLKPPPLPKGFLKQGDPSEEVTLIAVGRVISDWTLMEVAITRLFVTFLGVQGGYAAVAARAFGSVRTFDARLDMLQASSEVFFLIQNDRCKKIKSSLDGFFKTQKDKFDSIYRLLKRNASFRNEVAHGMVSNLFWEKTSISYALMPAPMDKKSSVFQIPSFAYSSKELSVFAETTRSLGQEVNLLNSIIRNLWQQLLEEETGSSD